MARCSFCNQGRYEKGRTQMKTKSAELERTDTELMNFIERVGCGPSRNSHGLFMQVVPLMTESAGTISIYTHNTARGAVAKAVNVEGTPQLSASSSKSAPRPTAPSTADCGKNGVRLTITIPAEWLPHIQRQGENATHGEDLHWLNQVCAKLTISAMAGEDGK